MQAMVTKIMQQSKLIMVAYFVKGVNEFVINFSEPAVLFQNVWLINYCFTLFEFHFKEVLLWKNIVELFAWLLVCKLCSILIWVQFAL